MRVKGDRLRRVVRQIHLWLGLGAGGLFVLLGLTGSILAFYPEIDALLHPAIRVEGSERPDWDRALATVRRAWPEKQGPWRFEVTGRPGAIAARYYDPPERAGHVFRPMMVWLSPDGGRVLRRDYWGEYAVTFVYDLHFRLLASSTGGTVLGWSGFVLLVLLGSGVWAWWPRASWAKALRIKRHAHPQRRLRDWHKLTGLAGLLLLLVLTATGIVLELPDESDRAFTAVGLPVDRLPVAMTMASHGGHRAGVDQIIAAALGALPGSRIAWIETAPQSGGNFRLRMQVPGDPSSRFPHSFVWVDGGSGQVVQVYDARKAGGGTVLNNWMHPLHDGSAGGLAGRVLVAISGLLPALLFVTGWLRWRGRRGAGRKTTA